MQICCDFSLRSMSNNQRFDTVLPEIMEVSEMKKNTRFLILVLSLAALVFSAVPTEVLAVGPDVYEELEEDSAEVLEMSDDAYEEPVTQVGEESSSEEQREVSEKIDDGVPGEIPDRIEDETSEDVEDETFEDVEEALKVEEGASAEIK